MLAEVPAAEEPPPHPHATRLADVERRHILAVLEAIGWRIRGPRGAATRLGLKPTTLEGRMAKLGIRRGPGPSHPAALPDFGGAIVAWRRATDLEILHALRSVLATTEVQPDCRRCRLYRDAQHDRAFLLVQEWMSQTALDRYRRSDVYRTVLAVLETASEPPEINFDTLAQRAGVEVVEIARRR